MNRADQRRRAPECSAPLGASDLRFHCGFDVVWRVPPLSTRSARRASNHDTALRQPLIIRKTIDERGRYDAARLGRLLGWSLADLGRYLKRDPSTISRSGSAQAHQDRLAALAALLQKVFTLMNEDLPATIAWFRTPIPALEWASPRDLILGGKFVKVRNLIAEVESGFSL